MVPRVWQPALSQKPYTNSSALSGVTYDLLVIGAIVLASSIVNGAIGAGGIFILLSSLVYFFGVDKAIPLLPLLAAGSILSRVILYRDYIEWPNIKQFGGGAAFGALLGVPLFAWLSSDTVGMLLGGFLIINTLWPSKPSHSGTPPHFMIVGAIHTAVSSVVGAGSILQSILIRAKTERKAMIGTVAACTLVMEVFKISGYLALGFNYTTYIPHIVLATLTGYAGTWAGRHLGTLISEGFFRRLVSIIIVCSAVQILLDSSGFLN